MRLRSVALAAASAALAVLPLAARAQSTPGGPPAGLTLAASFGGGGELGLSHGKAGVLELEGAAGFDLPELGLRPEVAIALGVNPDSHLALRPGVRWQVPGVPIQLRIAFDASNARDQDWGWRWLLLGAAGEVRLTDILGLFGELDTGIPLRGEAGVPLLLRVGASFRF